MNIIPYSKTESSRSIGTSGSVEHIASDRQKNYGTRLIREGVEVSSAAFDSKKLMFIKVNRLPSMVVAVFQGHNQTKARPYGEIKIESRSKRTKAHIPHGLQTTYAVLEAKASHHISINPQATMLSVVHIQGIKGSSRDIEDIVTKTQDRKPQLNLRVCLSDFVPSVVKTARTHQVCTTS